MGKEVTLSWDDFKKMGNPENALEVSEKSNKDFSYRKDLAVRLHYERKGRGGKEAVVIRGLEEDLEVLKEICNKIKSEIGVGGSVKNSEIIIQGKQRDKMLVILTEMGYTSTKKAGG